MSLTERLDRYQRRHTWAAYPLAVVYKYTDDIGGYLAALIAYYAFVSLFPLLLILSTVLGVVLAHNPSLQQTLLDSALHQFPVAGSQLEDPKHIGGGPAGLTIGILGAVYGGLGVAQALQHAMNSVWAVPRNERPNPLLSRLRSLLLVVAGGVVLLGTTALSALGSSGAGSLGIALRVLALVVSLALNTAAFVAIFLLATSKRLSLADVAPGAIAAGLVWQLLQAFGVVYVSHVIRNASATNGVFALVLGLLAFLYLTAVTVVMCAEINVVRAERLHPRSLLTPFTDDVDLTPGDRRSYATQAEAQRMKGFEEVEVTFQDDEATSEDETG